MSTPALSPLEQLAAQSPTQTSSTSGLSPLEQLAQTPPDTTTNDSGGTVIVPRLGESFDDTMKRAAAFGQTAQAKTEAAKESTPKNLGTKAAETLAAAPAIGAGGTAALAGVGAAGEQVAEWTPQLIKAVQAAAESHPVIAKIILRGLEGTAVGAGLKLAKLLPSQ